MPDGEPIRFFVAMTPIGKARARYSRGHVYTPKKTVEAEQAIAWECRLAMWKPFKGPVRLNWAAYFAPPKSWSRLKREDTFWHTGKPDIDNIKKLILDALNGVAWLDDSQVCFALGSKQYTSPFNPRPGLSICVREAA